MTDVAESSALVVMCLALIGSGVALLATRGSRTSAALLILAGAFGVTGVAMGRLGLDPARPWTAAGVLFLPLSLITYPRVRRSTPDLLAVTVSVAIGAAAVAYPGSGAIAVLATAVLSVVVIRTWWAFERGEAGERAPLAWVALALLVALCASFLGAFGGLGLVGTVAAILSLALIGPAMVVGVRAPTTSPRGALVWVTVTFTTVAGYIAAFGLVAAMVELLLGSPPTVGVQGLLAAALALGVHPLRHVLRGVVEELLFGRRRDPLDAAARVAGSVGDEPESALEAIRDALGLPYAAVVAGGVTLAESGSRVGTEAVRPLEPGSPGTRRLVVCLRSGELRLSRDDEQVLSLAGPLLAQTLRAHELAAEVRASRVTVISGVEDERRRLRRDLHDGLGPRLTGIAFTADAAINTLRSDGGATVALLSDLRAEAAAAIVEIRGLVDGLRPPSLDELGLVGALRLQLQSLRSASGQPISVELDADVPSGLPAAVEVAAYRIVTEALSNVARHAGSTRAIVRLEPSDHPGGRALLIEVRDGHAEGRRAEDPNTQWRPGVGLGSMRERAEELGGSFEAGPTQAGGYVLAVLPLTAPVPARLGATTAHE
ncbi:hypothetical protein H5399_03940 [Tessaracoccus sp. MC1627]|uniref:sensor histidine kinase n=1 Tax=Tessaracoccus sp. MC1627 TaxID=2760312 RepID=UPI00160045BE|nr:hypothetical protein [Tessaracoccus sp. MC1627]